MCEIDKQKNNKLLLIDFLMSKAFMQFETNRRAEEGDKRGWGHVACVARDYDYTQTINNFKVKRRCTDLEMDLYYL